MKKDKFENLKIALFIIVTFAFFFFVSIGYIETQKYMYAPTIVIGK